MASVEAVVPDNQLPGEPVQGQAIRACNGRAVSSSSSTKINPNEGL